MALSTFKKLLLAGLFCYLPFQSMAWGLLGHRIVGEIAERNLSRKAEKQVRKILGTESLAIASNWADFVKSDPAYDYLGPWHYVNFEQGLTYDQMGRYLAQDTVTDAYTKLTFLVKELKNKQLPKEKQQMYLRLLVHLAGDIHQPMHTGHAEDLGGNKIKLFWFNQPTNLHRLWDEQLVESQELSYTEYSTALNHTTKAQRKAWQQQPVSQWLFDSYQISNKLYAELQPEQKLSYKYNYDHLATLNEQLLKGGVHLAGLLNEIFG
ncbi:S1/P1 nuclease [Pontibacter liquoris]|uniref:S1/P1 nuclease n=1 Tax=Pontibacter liquoris TaxID=2905677 RepID=UPI001FA7604C|nr:S1/P1 nuclease [Pontibacter liquoris]